VKKSAQIISICLILLQFNVLGGPLAEAIERCEFSGYFSNLTTVLRQRVPADSRRITENFLTELLGDVNFVKALDQWQLLFKLGPSEMGNFARTSQAHRTFLAWFLNDSRVMDLYLETATPLGLQAREQNKYKLSTNSLDILRRIIEADAEAKDGLYLRLAIATALRPPGTGNRGAGMQQTPSDPVTRYLYFKKAHKNGELFPSFAKLSAWELQFVVSSCASESDLTWARELINTWRPDLRINEQVVNSTSEVKYGNSPHPYTDYKSVISGGGKCGPRSSWAVMVCQAFGIPAIGVGQPGHACVAYKAANPLLQPQPGSAWKIAYGRGWQVSRLEGLSGPDFLAGVEERARASDFSKVEHLRWLASALGTAEQSEAIMAIAHKIQKSVPPIKTDITASAKAEEAEKDAVAEKHDLRAQPPGAKSPIKVGKRVTRIEAADFSGLSGVRVLNCFTGGKQVNFEKNNQNGWIEYTIDVEAPGTYLLGIKIATPNDDQVLNIDLGPNKPQTIKLPNTTGLWGMTEPVEISLERGIQKIRISAPFQRGVAVRYLEFKPNKYE